MLVSFVSKSKGVSKLRKTSILVLVFFLSIVSIILGCNIEEPNLEQLEQQRINLYIEVMSSVFQEENGGSHFIAIDLDTLEGLSSIGNLASISIEYNAKFKNENWELKEASKSIS